MLKEFCLKHPKVASVPATWSCLNIYLPYLKLNYLLIVDVFTFVTMSAHPSSPTLTLARSDALSAMLAFWSTYGCKDN